LSKLILLVIIRHSYYKEVKLKILFDLSCTLLSEALKEVLSNEKDFVIIHNILDDLPDIVITDTCKLKSGLKEKYPNSNFIIIDLGQKRDEILSALISYTLKGVISSDTGIELFKKALRSINDGQVWLSNTLTSLLLNNKNLKKSGRIEFTDKEKNIIQLICEGRSNREIAREIFVSEQTVKTHLNRIYRKLNIKNRYQLINIFHNQ